MRIFHNSRKKTLTPCFYPKGLEIWSSILTLEIQNFDIKFWCIPEIATCGNYHIHPKKAVSYSLLISGFKLLFSSISILLVNLIWRVCDLQILGLTDHIFQQLHGKSNKTAPSWNIIGSYFYSICIVDVIIWLFHIKISR